MTMKSRCKKWKKHKKCSLFSSRN